ncbi:MAG: diguanylate cyclase, partial [Methylophaga sp.]|nr:diguanylate cyclase [Methylophaga sp.]
MFKNWRIRSLLHVWAVMTIFTIVLMSALSIGNHKRYADNQSMLMDNLLPLQDSSREIIAIAAEFIARQQLILHADSRQMLVNVPNRVQLEQRFELQWQRLLSLSRRMQIDQQLLLPLQQNYQHFLQTDQQIFDLMLRQHQLNEQRSTLNPSAEVARRLSLQQQTNQQRLRNVLGQSVEVLEKLQDSLRQLTSQVTAHNQQQLNQSKTMITDFRSLVWLISGVLIFAMLIFVMLLSQRIQQPLKKLRQGMRALTAENFAIRLPETTSRSEFSLLAKDFNQFAANTEQLILALDKARYRLQDREQQLSTILSSVPEAILTLSAEGRIIDCNLAAEKVFAAAAEDIQDQPLARFIRQAEWMTLQEISSQQQRNHEYAGTNYRGQPIVLWLSLSPLAEQESIAWVAVVSDITSWKQTEQTLRQTSNELNAIFENAMVGIAFVKNRQLVRTNHKFEQLFADVDKQLEGQSARCLHTSEDAFQRFGEQAYSALAQGENFEAQLEMVRLNGERFWCSLSGQAVDSAAPAAGSIWLYEDVTQQRQNEDRLIRLASLDPLTGLPNRSVFNDRLEHAIHKLQRNSGRLAVFFIDLDHFKHINDSLGHRAGDALLCEVSRRIRSCVRESDTVARLGGDEFTVVLEDITSAQYVGRIAEKILTTTSLPYMLDNVEVNISPSIGISLYPADGRDVDMLIRNA